MALCFELAARYRNTLIVWEYGDKPVMAGFNCLIAVEVFAFWVDAAKRMIYTEFTFYAQMQENAPSSKYQIFDSR